MKKILALVLALAMVLGLAACGSSGSGSGSGSQSGSQTSNSDFKVGAIYINKKSDTAGYTYAHHTGITKAMKELGMDPETQLVIVDQVPEDDTQVGAAVDTLVGEGCSIIFGISFGYLNEMEVKAQEYPDVIFSHATGFKSNDTNFNNYFGRIYQARYLAGIAAGLKSLETGNNNIGYVSAYDTEYAETCSGINGFTLGAQSVNPDIEVRVVWTNAWYDPGKEADAAKTLIGQGCDIISHHTNSQAVAAAGEDAKVPVISYHAEMHKAAPTMLIGAVTHHWDEYYAKRIQAVLDGTWKTAPMWGGAELHMVRLSGITPKAPKAVVDDINATYAKMEKQAFNVFTGPIVDNTGKTVIPAGSAADDKHLLTMNYFVKGVLGKVPSNQ